MKPITECPKSPSFGHEWHRVTKSGTLQCRKCFKIHTPPWATTKEGDIEEMLPSATVLDEAARITAGARNRDYGTPNDNHWRTAQLWSAYLGVPVTARQVCWMNVLQKASRDAHAPVRDNLVDGCGFLRNAELCEDEPPA